MKQFFEQYGGVALGILALLVLIAMITPVGNIIKTSLQGTTEKFSTSINSQTDAMSKQMEAAFVNATGFTGVKDNTYYFNGQVHPFFKENEIVLNEDATRATGKDGLIVDSIILDANVIYHDIRQTAGLTGLQFDYYINEVKVSENYRDANYPISLLDNPEIKIVITSVPDGIKVSNMEYNYKLQDIDCVFLSSTRTILCFETPIYAYDA